MNFFDSMRSNFEKLIFHNIFCAKCNISLDKKKAKKCKWCNKYYCKKHLPAKNHSKKCQKKYLDYKSLVERRKAEVRAITKKEKEEQKEKEEYEKNQAFWEIHCAKCKKEFIDWRNSHKCRYCGKYFCTDHWVPESHDCSGHPERPPGGFREVHSGGTIKAYGK